MLRLRRNKRVALLVLASSEPIRCDWLSATITVATCVARWQRAQDRSCVRIDGHSLSGKGDAGAAYISCRDCPDGAERSKIAGNDNARGGR